MPGNIILRAYNPLRLFLKWKKEARKFGFSFTWYGIQVKQGVKLEDQIFSAAGVFLEYCFAIEILPSSVTGYLGNIVRSTKEVDYFYMVIGYFFLNKSMYVLVQQNEIRKNGDDVSSTPRRLFFRKITPAMRKIIDEEAAKHKEKLAKEKRILQSYDDQMGGINKKND